MTEHLVKVQMLEYVSGGRHDGTVWPPAGGALMVPDWEARDLYLGRLARPWPFGDPEPETAVAEADQEHVAVPVAPPEVSPVAEASETAVPAGGDAPRPSAPKAEWVAWAVKCGVSEDAANGMSKAELMEKYGARA